MPVAPRPAQDKPSLAGMDMQEMVRAVAEAGLEPFRAKQLWNWIYARGVTDFDAMTNIAKPARAKLKDAFTVARPHVARALTSTDGTRKWLLEFPDANQVETVFIPEDDRGALCVSSQVGCTLTCTFCHTGTQPLVRNLRAGEIVGQVMLARDAMDEWPSFSLPHRGREGVGASGSVEKGLSTTRPPPSLPPAGGGASFTNIVMMGMGEPLFNYDHVAKALKIVMDAGGIAISKRKITLSTSGVVPKIEQCGRELGVNLAISLHAVRDDLRDVLVPINKKYKIAELLDACRNYPAASNARRITFEYVMLKGVNDTDADARELVRLLKHIHAKVNLIPFNPWPGAPYECSSNNRIHAFAQIVNDAGYSSPIRTPRGRDIFAACGQLKSDSERKGKVERV